MDMDMEYKGKIMQECYAIKIHDIKWSRLMDASGNFHDKSHSQKKSKEENKITYMNIIFSALYVWWIHDVDDRLHT